jgi:hypothetical protein
MRRLFLVAFFTCAAAQASTSEYRDLYKSLEPLSRLQGLRYVVADTRLSSNDQGVSPETIRLTIRARGGDIVVPVDPDGHFRFPITQALCDENPPVETNQPEKSLKMQAKIDVSAPAQQSFDYALLAAMDADYREAVSRQSLMMRMLAPGSKGFVLRFDSRAEAIATVQLPDGALRFASDEKGTIRIPDKSEWRKLNPRIDVSVLPTKVSLDFGE